MVPDTLSVESQIAETDILDYAEHHPSFPVGFVIDTDGSITEPKVVRSVHPLLDAEALRVVKFMPKC